jgi:hypothetical protein
MPAKKIDQHIVIGDPAFGVPEDPFQDFGQGQDFHLQVGFFENLPDHGLLEGLSRPDDPSRDRPLAQARLLPPFDQQDLVLPENDSSHPDDRMFRILAVHARRRAVKER